MNVDVDISQNIGDTLTGLAVSINRIRPVAAILDLLAHGSLNFLMVIRDIDAVIGPFAAGLTCTDIYGGYTQKGAFSDAGTGIAD